MTWYFGYSAVWHRCPASFSACAIVNRSRNAPECITPRSHLKHFAIESLESKQEKMWFSGKVDENVPMRLLELRDADA